jgi:hypothetical protein
MCRTLISSARHFAKTEHCCRAEHVRFLSARLRKGLSSREEPFLCQYSDDFVELNYRVADESEIHAEHFQNIGSRREGLRSAISLERPVDGIRVALTKFAGLAISPADELAGILHR